MLTRSESQVLAVIVCQVDHFNHPPLPFEQGFQVAKAKARGPVFVFHHNGADALIFEERQKLRSIGKDAKEGVGTLTALLDQYAEKVSAQPG